MKRGALLILLCLMLAVCSAVQAEQSSRHIFLINDEPQMQISVGSSWSVTPVELNRHQFMGFDPIQEYAHRDGVHTLRVYFIPYNGAFTPPASLNLIKKNLSSHGIQARDDQLNGAPVLEGALAPSQKGYGVILQDTLQYGYFAIIGFPQKGAALSDQDEEIQSILLSARRAGSFEYAVQGDGNGQAAKDDQRGHSAEETAPAAGSAAELKAQYDAMAARVSKLEEELSALQKTSSSQMTEISAMEEEAEAVSRDGEALLAQLEETRNEINILSAYIKCAGCGYTFSWSPDFLYCPKCGVARAIPEKAPDGLTEQHYNDLQAEEAVLRERYEGISALAKNTRQALEELKSANAALDAEILKAQSELEKARADAAGLQKQLEEAIEASETQGKCVNCGYVFPEGSAFNFCPKCGTRR